MTEDVHRQLADYFGDKILAPYLYTLSKKLSQGHICIDVDKVNIEEDLPESYDVKAISSIKNNILLGKPQDHKPLILDASRLYFQRYYNYETAVVEVVKRLAGREVRKPDGKELKQWQEMLKLFIPTSAGEESLVNWQKVAAVLAALQSFTIITGGPGTGKTTTVAAVLALLFSTNADLSVAVAAPTGKAAARVAESLRNTISDKKLTEEIKHKFLSLEPFTLHRLLGYKPGTTEFAHNENSPLRYDVIIVDECSMIDAALLAKLLRSLHPRTRLILLGDKDQLAAVEAGSIFGDLCRSVASLNHFSPAIGEIINNCLPEKKEQLTAANTSAGATSILQNNIVVLQHSHRFNDKSGIGKLSKAIISGDKEIVGSFFDSNDDSVKIVETLQEKYFHEFVEKYYTYIKEKDNTKALAALLDCKILCAVKEGTDGVGNYNRMVQSRLIDKGLIHYDQPFYINRPIMVTSNMYNLGLFNGDVGIIRGNDDGKRMAYFEKADGSLMEVWPGYLQGVETVYAMTIHKSQGSEYREAYIVLPGETGSKVMSAELLYTAITRAKETVTIQGSNEVILDAVARKLDRSSGIVERMN